MPDTTLSTGYNLGEEKKKSKFPAFEGSTLQWRRWNINK